MFVSLACGFLLFILTFGQSARSKGVAMPRTSVPGKGFAALRVDASWPDRHIRELLARRGLTATIGESSQWVFLDGFGTLEQIPLDSYWDRVESFDPRNDGYAERLQSFFVFNGERRIFIDLKGAPLDLEGRVRAALGDIPYSFSILTPPRSPVVPIILFVLAAALTLRLSGDILAALFFLPLWAPLAALGAPGFSLIAVLAGLWGLLREPARDYYMFRRYRKAGASAAPSAGVWILAGLFLAVAALLAVFGRFPPLTVPAALVLFPLVLCFSLWTESYRGAEEGHIRFKPVQITPLARRPLSYSPVMVPFALAALVLPLLSMVFPAPASGISGEGARSWTGWESPQGLSADHYREHALFQQTFSYTPLESGKSPYLRYSLGDDGLIGGDASVPVVAEPEPVPPFPLASLIDFLADYAYTENSPVSPRGGDVLCPLIVLGLCVPLILRDRRWRRMRGKLSMYMEKRIAA
jgi:hypothetical protein